MRTSGGQIASTFVGINLVVSSEFSRLLGTPPTQQKMLRENGDPYTRLPLYSIPEVLSPLIVSTDGFVVSCVGWPQLLTWVIKCQDTSGLPNDVKKYLDLNSQKCETVKKCATGEEQLEPPSWSSDRVCGIKTCPPVRKILAAVSLHFTSEAVKGPISYSTALNYCVSSVLAFGLFWVATTAEQIAGTAVQRGASVLNSLSY